MEIVQKHEGNALCIALSGELGHHEALTAMRVIGESIGEGVPRSVVLDLSDVGFMDSSGIAVVLRTFQACQAAGGHFCVRGARKQARRVLDAAGLDKLISFI
ncbi:MAG TPA: anti-sigma factor antagonist [Candidatus Ventrousia excrementavium]|uniref:Anti-sigma factor antagonist n=1 Tax=Candidatus Ventrousia excrementavium TaxID=2840961 RepID=A0A9D1LLH6_9CLOT|nr:anti-sigma factor antagonist [Candidatus Ventrousia excrementavium]